MSIADIELKQTQTRALIEQLRKDIDVLEQCLDNEIAFLHELDLIWLHTKFINALDTTSPERDAPQC